VRFQVLDLLMRLQDELGLAYIFISHDIGVIRYMCDRVGVMYRGKLVEVGEADKVCNAPDHPYTQALISAIPRPDPRDRDHSRRFRYTEPSAAKNGSSAR
ncbi:ABC transporter ATP-binding protein, partial [Neorhizobium sp. R1-B]